MRPAAAIPLFVFGSTPPPQAHQQLLECWEGDSRCRAHRKVKNSLISSEPGFSQGFVTNWRGISTWSDNKSHRFCCYLSNDVDFTSRLGVIPKTMLLSHKHNNCCLTSTTITVSHTLSCLHAGENKTIEWAMQGCMLHF